MGPKAVGGVHLGNKVWEVYWERVRGNGQGGSGRAAVEAEEVNSVKAPAELGLVVVAAACPGGGGQPMGLWTTGVRTAAKDYGARSAGRDSRNGGNRWDRRGRQGLAA